MLAEFIKTEESRVEYTACDDCQKQVPIKDAVEVFKKDSPDDISRFTLVCPDCADIRDAYGQ
jgi:ribosomal protein S26